MRSIYYIFSIGLVAVSAWYLGRPGNPPAPAVTLGIPKVTGSVKGVLSDRVKPESKWLTKPQRANKGSILNGTATDIGSGVVEVAVQIQRGKDAAVWNGSSWQVGVGATQDAIFSGHTFSYTIPTDLNLGEAYVIRTQAIDASGNAQTKWNELGVIGGDVTSNNIITN